MKKSYHFEIEGQITGIMITLNKGGKVHLFDESGAFGETLEFHSNRIRDIGNFLVSFLHGRGYIKPTVIFDGKKYPYIEPNFGKVQFGDVIREYVLIQDEYGDMIEVEPYDTINLLSDNYPSITIADIMSGKKMTQRFYSKNHAINEILNFNQVDPKLVKKYKMIHTLHEKVLKGHTTIPVELEGKFFTTSGRVLPFEPPSVNKLYKIPFNDPLKNF